MWSYIVIHDPKTLHRCLYMFTYCLWYGIIDLSIIYCLISCSGYIFIIVIVMKNASSVWMEKCLIYWLSSSNICPIISLGFFRDCGGSVKLKVVFSLKQICFNFCFPLTNIVRKEKTLKIVLTCCVQIWDAFQKWKVTIHLFLLLFLS